jgi:large subunit ribosomal protein L29
MKASEMRALSLDEARHKVDDFREELFNLTFQHASGQLENNQKIKQVKRDIARLKTVINETVLSKKRNDND